jgi:hypothetical protein
MMTGPLLLATAAWVLRPTFLQSFTTSTSRAVTNRLVHRLGRNPTVFSTTRLFATDPSFASLVESRISRVSTLQILLQKHGAPGSQGCRQCNDLVPVSTSVTTLLETPELITSMSNIKVGTVSNNDEEFKNLHPYLFPICQSMTTGNLICAYRDPGHEREKVSTHPKPWPIVEAKVGGPGIHLLALNSEHLLRRIVCELDFTDTEPELIALYNEGLGLGRLKDPSLDSPYVQKSVAKLGYGVDKYVLLRVGPFPDLYEQMAREHYSKGDESSALIAAETSNGKLSGFASTFRFYARLLSSFPHRAEEVRDAARMCLRMSLPTIGMNMADFEEVAMLGNMSNEFDSPEIALQKLGDMHELIRSVEKDDDKIVKNPVELALDEASQLIDKTVLEQKEWSSIRPQLAQIFRSIGRDEMAAFVDF